MTTLREFFIWLSKNTSKRFPPRNCIKYHLLHKWRGRWGGIIIRLLTFGSRGQDSSPSAFILLCSWVGYVPTIPLFIHEYKWVPQSCQRNLTKLCGVVGQVNCGGLAFYEILHVNSLPTNPSPRRRERSGSCAIHSRMWTYTYLFFSNKQKLAIYLLAIFVIWSLLLTHNSLFFLLQFFKFFLKKYAKNLSFFLFCLYSLKKCERAVDKSPQ